jgi:hypothetical protein
VQLWVAMHQCVQPHPDEGVEDIDMEEQCGQSQVDGIKVGAWTSGVAI